MKKNRPKKGQQAIPAPEAKAPFSIDNLVSKRRYSDLFILCVLAVITFTIYSNTLKGPFIFDSVLHIKNNPNVHMNQLTPGQIKKAAFQLGSRPIPNISLALNYYLHGNDVVYYRLTNILIHILTGFFLFYLTKATLLLPALPESYSRYQWVPFLTALLWIIHPLQIQSVTYVIQRMNSLAVMFFLLSLLLYARARIAKGNLKKRMLFSGCIIAGFLALGSKQIAATLPVFIFLYEWYFFQDLEWAWIRRHRIFFAALLIFLTFLTFLFFQTDYWQKVMALYAVKDFTMVERLLTESRVVIFYLGLLVFPHPSRLNLDHDFTISHSIVNPPTTLIAIGAIALFLLLAVYLARKERLLSFCILWFLGNLVIESTFIPLALIYEHRLYLPSMAVCLLAVFLGSRYVKSRRVKIGAVCLVALVFSVWTYQRNEVWKDDVVFWRDCASKSPEKGRPYLNLGVALRERGKFDESIRAFYKALQFDPGDEKVHFNLGVALEKQGKTDEAVKYYLNALKIKEDFADAHNNLGIALVNQGKYDEAITHHLEAIRIRPKYARAYNSLGVALEKQGNPAEAVTQYKKALELSPDYTLAYYNLAGAYMRLGDFDNAIPNYYEALRRDPSYSRAHYNLGVALLRQGKPRDAAFHFAETLRIDPNDLRARRALQLLSR